MGVFYFPTNFVYWRNIPEHHKFKKTLMDYIEREELHSFRTHSLIKDGKTTNDHIKTQEFLVENKEFIQSIVWDTLDEVLKELNSGDIRVKTYIKSSTIDQCWLSKYDQNGKIVTHNHQTTGRESTILNGRRFLQSFTLIYIINDQNEQNSTSFVQETPTCISSYLYRKHEFKTSLIKEIGEGTVLMFPSNLDHHANENLIPGRIIFSCDILSEFVDK
jgi:hypothetical protein